MELATVTLESVHNNLTEDGVFVSASGRTVDLDHVFRHGAWLDASEIPIINNENE